MLRQYIDSYEKTNNFKDYVKKEKTKQRKIVTLDGCLCKKSNCLRLYCSCYKSGNRCSDECKCSNCLNTRRYEQVRQFAIKKTKVIQKFAFEKEVIEIQGKKILKYGCECVTDCSNGHCNCIRNKVGCY